MGYMRILLYVPKAIFYLLKGDYRPATGAYLSLLAFHGEWRREYADYYQGESPEYVQCRDPLCPVPLQLRAVQSTIVSKPRTNPKMPLPANDSAHLLHTPCRSTMQKPFSVLGMLRQTIPKQCAAK